MKLQVPENAREAFQFLALGAGALLVLRLVITLLGSIIGDNPAEELGMATAPYRAGYPLLREDTLAIETAGAVPRMAMAGLFTLLAGGLLALLALPVGAISKWGPLRASVFGARTGLVLGGVWAIWCLLAFPAHRVVVTDAGLVRYDSRTFLGMVAIPFTQVERTNTWQEVQALGSGGPTAPTMRCGELEEVHAMLPEGRVIIACAPPGAGECTAVRAQQKANAERLLHTLSARWKPKVVPT